VTLTGHERAKLAVLHNKAFPSDLTKIKAGKGALGEFIATRHRRLRNGSQGAFKLKYDLACSVERRPHQGRMPMTVKAGP